MRISRRRFIIKAGTAAALPVLSGAALAQSAAPPAAAGPTKPPAPAPAAPPAPPPAPKFSFDTVKAQAAKLATTSYNYGPIQLPDSLKALDYNHYRQIQYRHDRAMWHESGLFRVEFFHLGFIYPYRVGINVVENGEVKPVAYSPENFNFNTYDPGVNTFKPDFPADLGFAGFRLHFPLNVSTKFDEVAVWQGGSYFRLLGRNQQYGLSGRGLAINTAEPEGEEFPYFTEFWLERPSETDTSMTVYALLDSKSTTGAYRFVVTPDMNTTLDVEAVLFPRLDIKKPGFGALTSMYLHGKPDVRPFADIHPEDHDSDGLMLHTGAGEWLWRQLLDPQQLRVSTFTDTHPQGYGLIQRERSFEAYQDLDDRYEIRPNYWVEPKGDWGKGAVQLVEIPSDSDTNDNMVAYWVPDTPVKAGKPVDFAYSINAYLERPDLPPTGYCIATRTGPPDAAVDASHSPNIGSPRRFDVDFGGPQVTMIDASLPVQAHITASSGTITAIETQKLPGGAWRATFVYAAEGRQDSELRGFLSLFGSPLTETWLFRWSVQ
jgi:glucans biosynthesis protein